MTNIEKLAMDICRMKNRRKIMKALPLFLEVRIQHGGDGENEPSVFVGDIAISTEPTELLKHAG